MSNRALATLAIRLLGVYAWFMVFTVLPNLVLYVTDEGRYSMPYSLVMAVALLVWSALGFLLVFRSERFARLVLPATDEADAAEPEPKELQAVLFSVVGLVLVVHVLPQLVFTLWNLSADDAGSGARYFWASATSNLAQLLLGVGLFVGSRGLARFWRHLGEMNRAP